MSESLIRLKRERYHIDIRKQKLETIFSKKRVIPKLLPIALNHVYPIEKFIEIINRMNFEELSEDDQNILKCVLDMIYNTILTDWPQFQHWVNHLSIVESLLLTMQYQCNKEVAEKASNCFQLLIRMKTQRMLVEEHLNKFVEIYKTWFESPQLRDTAVNGLYHLVSQQHIRNLNDSDLVESLLKIYYDKDKSEQHGKVLQVFGEITKNLTDDQKIIKIVRLASKLIEHTDNKLKIKGLRILENATSNVQNIQFLLSMNCMQLIIDMVTYKDKLISELCVQIIYNLCFTVEKDEMQKLIDLGCLNVVLRIIKNGNIQQRQKAVYIMSNMMASDCEILKQIMQATVLIEILIDKMRTETPLVKINIFHCWKNYIIACNTELLLQLLNYHILDDLIYGLQDESKFALLCLEILSQILIKLNGTIYETDVKVYLELKSLPTIIENIRLENDDEILYEACCKFSHLFYDRDLFHFDQRFYIKQCF